MRFMSIKNRVLPYAFLVFLAAILPVQADYTLVLPPRHDDPMKVHVYRLDNGLTVYLSENHQEPRFYAEILVRAGSKHDPTDATGIAHYLEHMLFKGSGRIGTLDYESEKKHLDRIVALYEEHFNERFEPRRQEIYAEINREAQAAAKFAIPNELDRLYTAMGERALNAHTSLEETVYKVDLPSNRFDHWAKVESERFVDPVFRLFQTELETVYEEKNRSMDDKGRVIRAAVARQLYKTHPYGNTTLGSVEHLKNPSLERMYEFYRTYYVPGNMAIAVSGNIHIPDAIERIDIEFSRWQPVQVKSEPKWKEPEIKEIERVSVPYRGEEYVLLAFRTAPGGHKDAEVLEVLDMILDNKVAGLINLNLNQQQRVREAGAYPWLNNDYGAQYLWGIPKDGQSLKEVEGLLTEQLEFIKSGDFEEWIIPAIITDFEKRHKEKLEGNGPRVSLMRDAFISRTEWKNASKKLERIRKVKKKHVVKAARKYFKGAYVSGYRVDGEPDIPTIQKPELDTIEIDASRKSAFCSHIMGLPYDEIDPVYVVPGRDYKVKTVRDGVKLYYAHNPLNDLFALSINVDFGTLADNRLAVAQELMDKSGTALLSAQDLKKEWYKLGTDFSPSVGAHESTLSISGLDANLDTSLSQLLTFVRAPVAEEASLENLKQIILKKRADAMKDNRTLFDALHRYNRYGDSSQYRRVPTNQELLGFTIEELHELFSNLLSYEQSVTYVGSKSSEEVIGLLQKAYGGIGDLRSPPPYQVLVPRAPEETELYFLHKEMAQALVRIEYGGEGYVESRRPAIDLYNDYFFGGMGGIVSQELREARALAYSAQGRYFTGERKAEPSVMVGFIGCQADKTAQALDVFVDLIDDLPESSERFSAAKRSLENQYRTSRLGFRQVLAAVRKWERQEVPVDPRAWRFEQIRGASLEKVLEFHREHVGGRAKLVSIVGDREKVGLEGLRASRQVVELQVEDLFGY
jgi:predicted Zn-dependent peptidase